MMLIVKLRGLVRLVAIKCRKGILKAYGMNIDKTARISFGANLDKTNPKGIFIGEESYVASGAIILSHDYSRSIHTDTIVGKRCFIGANAIILPGVKIGDNSIVGAGSVVTKDVPNCCIVAGNPAKVVRTNIITKKWGQLA